MNQHTSSLSANFAYMNYTEGSLLLTRYLHHSKLAQHYNFSLL